MLVTTGLQGTPELKKAAQEAAIHLNAVYVERGEASISALFQQSDTDRLLVFTKKGLFAYQKGVATPAFFHPGLALLRIKNIMRGDNDKMVEAAQLKEGDAFLDGTLGWGADAIVASYVVGKKGRVVGIEADPVIAYMTKIGLQSWQEADPEATEAMRRIEVLTGKHDEVLKELPDSSFDVVYFDPMFRSPIEHSPGITPLRLWADPSPLKKETISEALRVSRRNVMMKERMGSGEFERLGFNPIPRPFATFTFGVIEK